MSYTHTQTFTEVRYCNHLGIFQTTWRIPKADKLDTGGEALSSTYTTEARKQLLPNVPARVERWNPARENDTAQNSFNAAVVTPEEGKEAFNWEEIRPTKTIPLNYCHYEDPLTSSFCKWKKFGEIVNLSFESWGFS